MIASERKVYPLSAHGEKDAPILKTKGKLTFIVTIIGGILFLVASFLMWNSIAAYRKSNTVTPSLEALRLLKELQSRLHGRQYNLIQQTKENKPWNTRCP